TGQQHLHTVPLTAFRALTELSRTRTRPSRRSSGRCRWWSSTGTARNRCGELFEGREEERVHAGTEVGELRRVGVAGGAEDPVGGVGGSGNGGGERETRGGRGEG